VRFDAMGLVLATFALGKPERDEGDRFDDTSAELAAGDDPTTRLEHQPFNWMENRRPNFVHALVREQHGAANPRWQESYSYFDGLGREIEQKLQAEPGSAPARAGDGTLLRNGDGTLVWAPAAPRWVGTGRTVVDNKGNPVKKYQPFFDSTHAFVDEQELVEFGVTPILRYDPLGRLVRTDLPDGSFSRVEFDAWREMRFDANDTVLESRWYAERGSPDPALPAPADPRIRSAWLAAQHADTPTVAHLDSFGRVFLTMADNGPALDGTPRQFETRIAFDIEGNQSSVTSAVRSFATTTTCSVSQCTRSAWTRGHGGRLPTSAAERFVAGTVATMSSRPVMTRSDGGRTSSSRLATNQRRWSSGSSMASRIRIRILPRPASTRPAR
jgi:hypothetical protein